MSIEQVRSRLDFMKFSSAQRRTVATVRPIIGRLIGPALDRFYAQVRANPLTARFFRDRGHMDSAKAAQQSHWMHIASGEFDEAFYKSVRRIGTVHARIGLEPRWYVGAYALVLEQLLEGIGRECSPWRRLLRGFRLPKASTASASVVKAALLDMELSVSIFFEEAQAEREAAISSMEKALAALAAGDLSTDLTGLPPSFAALETSYNQTLATMRGMIGAVSGSAHLIRQGSDEIAQASEDLADRTERNAASLAETSTSVVEMDGRLRATADAAGRTLVCADGAIESVASGRSIATGVVAAMERVADSAKGIDDVIEGLDKVAFQTRVLAMNAAVEAGRAGDAGRGFAVVADLVSALAMRAEEEAKAARSQLTTTRAEIDAAVEAVQQVDGALESIANGVGEVHNLIGGIANDNQAQSQSIGQIATAIAAMDQATQQNAAMVEQTSAAARNLLGEVGQLTASAARFQLAGKAAGTGRGARAAARRSAPVMAD